MRSRGGGAAAAVLFEPESVPGNTQTSKQKRQALAADARRRTEGAGECLTPWDVQSKRVYSPDACGPTLPSGTGEGVNIQPVVMAHTHSHAEIGEGGVTPTLTAHNAKDAPVVIDRAAFNQGQNAQYAPHIEQTELMDTLVARGPHAIGRSHVVRRLTPLECERLQGMPDEHTLVPYRGKPAEECPDGLRYKAIGNSMAVPVMRWIGERMQKVDEILT